MAFEGIFFTEVQKKNSHLQNLDLNISEVILFLNQYYSFVGPMHTLMNTSHINPESTNPILAGLDWCECCHSLVDEHPSSSKGGSLICLTTLCISQEEEEGTYFHGNAMSSVWLV